MARILIADDSSIMRRNLCTILTQAGHTIVAQANNGENAIKEYEKQKPDLVTMDINMPVVNGLTVLKTIMSTDPNANVVMISALEQKFMVLTAIKNGAKYYIVKPFCPEKVVEVVDRVLRLV